MNSKAFIDKYRIASTTNDLVKITKLDQMFQTFPDKNHEFYPEAISISRNDNKNKRYGANVKISPYQHVISSTSKNVSSYPEGISACNYLDHLSEIEERSGKAYIINSQSWLDSYVTEIEFSQNFYMKKEDSRRILKSLMHARMDRISSRHIYETGVLLGNASWSFTFYSKEEEMINNHTALYEENPQKYKNILRMDLRLKHMEAVRTHLYNGVTIGSIVFSDIATCCILSKLQEIKGVGIYG